MYKVFGFTEIGQAEAIYLPNRSVSRESKDFFEDDEAYLVSEESGEKTINPSFDQNKSNTKIRDRYIRNTLQGCDESEKARLHNKMCDPMNSDYYNFEAARKLDYPSIEDQLDFIYHHGIEAWKTEIITPIKNKFPKP